MSIYGIGTAGYPVTGYEPRKTQRRNNASEMGSVTQTSQMPSGTFELHISNDTDGEAVGAICGSDYSMTVYQPKDFDPANPEYKVKVWDKEGNVTERMVDVSKVDTRSSDYVDMFAYASHLSASGEYPDFIEGGSGTLQLYEAGALVALDDYLDNYPNIKALFTEQQWDQLRQDDGKIYWIPQFSCIKNKESVCTHNDEAFWIQTRVLKWADYPEIKTMDQYFDLIEAYNEANPTMEDGTPNIPYTILCEDWRYFCLENAPQFLDGYPNDGSVIVDPDTLKVIDYNTTPTAKRYFQKLNEEYKKGIVDPESFTQTYDEYIAKVSTGRVLGMIDQWWDFAYTAGDAIRQQGLDAEGCNYVPLPITIEEGIQNQWHNSGGVLNVSSGLAITVSCEDVEGALKFVDDLLSQEIHNLRYWGVEGVDYQVDENGLFYRTEEQRMNVSDTAYKASHICSYSYFPNWLGTSRDGINAMQPTEQPFEFMDSLAEPVVKCFEAYGVSTYPGMLGSVNKAGKWYPMYSFSNTMTTATPGGVAWTKMGEVKHEWLPKIVMMDNFDDAWEQYMEVYSACKPEDFISEMQAELDRRVAQ